MTGRPLFSPGPGADAERKIYGPDGLKRESSAPCQLHCPAGIDIPSYVALTGQGRYDEAVDVIRRDNPFPWVCGLICPNPCEAWCQRRHLDKALAIKDLKGLAARMAFEKRGGYSNPVPQNRYAEKVAVVGAGPAGLSAAYFLAGQGYSVTVFEAMQAPGGLLATGIPEYRLPRHIVSQEIEAIKGMGVEIIVNTPVGTDLTLDRLRKEGYRAFFLGMGAWESVRLGIEGEEQFPQVISVLDFLKDVSFGLKIKPANRVAVIGGGNAAIDAARTLVRLGAESVSIVYRRTRSEMPAHLEEVIQAAEEGIHVHQLTIPIRIGGAYGKVDYLECAMASLGEPDDTGRRRPVPVPDSQYRMPVGAVIEAIGQRTAVGQYPGLGGLELSKWGNVQIRGYTQQTSVEDVFAGGDAVTGPATVIQAIASGKRAAAGIHAYLRGLPAPRQTAPRPRRMIEPIRMDYQAKAFIQRQEIPLIDLDRRMHTFDRVELGLDEIAAKQEAARCMRCDICERCGKCEQVCSERLGASAISFYHSGESSLILKDYVHGLPHCIGCGACVNICPTGALQMEEQGNLRLLLMCGTIVNKVKMEQCERCGAFHASAVMIRHLENLLEVPEELFDQKLCADCKRVVRASKMVGEPVDI
ncbi:MAG: FAD-dependent oxidoreductase [Syntrophobacteraceae bacterium]